MYYVRIVFNFYEFFDFDCISFGYVIDVILFKIDEYNVFGVFFFIC